MPDTLVLSLILAAVSGALGIGYYRSRTALTALRARFAPISVKAGERMTKQYTKLPVRSFNAECDAAIAKVTWINLATMSERIRKSFDALNGELQKLERGVLIAFTVR